MTFLGLSETLLAALITGPLAALITNSDRVIPLIMALRRSKAESLAGEWMGVFREFHMDLGRDEISSEKVTLKSKGAAYAGTVDSVGAMVRGAKCSVVQGSSSSSILPSGRKRLVRLRTC